MYESPSTRILCGWTKTVRRADERGERNKKQVKALLLTMMILGESLPASCTRTQTEASTNKLATAIPVPPRSSDTGRPNMVGNIAVSTSKRMRTYICSNIHFQAP